MSRLLITLAAAVVVACVAAEDVSNQNTQLYIYEQKINETLKNISAKLAEYDPYLIPKIQLNVEHPLGRINFDVEDVLLSGHSKFWATNLKISTIPPWAPSVTFDVQFEGIHVLAAYYNLDAFAVFIPFYGNGFMNLRSTLINLGGSAKVKLGIGSITSISNVKARFNLEKSNLIISGILHNEPMSKIISTATTECFPEFVNTYGERLGQLVGQLIEEIVNIALKPSSADDTQVSYGIPPKGGDTVMIGNATVKYYYEL